MAILVALFLDLASLPVAKGDDALYRQAMIDHHLAGKYDVIAGVTCGHVFELSSDVPPAATESFIANNRKKGEATPVAIHFSAIGWSPKLAVVQLTTSDATSCLLYRRLGASYRLAREMRFPH